MFFVFVAKRANKKSYIAGYTGIAGFEIFLAVFGVLCGEKREFFFCVVTIMFGFCVDWWRQVCFTVELEEYFGRFTREVAYHLR